MTHQERLRFYVGEADKLRTEKRELREELNTLRQRVGKQADELRSLLHYYKSGDTDFREELQSVHDELVAMTGYWSSEKTPG